MSTTGLTETQLIDVLTAPEVSQRLGLHLGPDAQAVALSARGNIFQVTDACQRHIVRLHRDHTHLVSLRREARIATALAGHLSLRVPDTRVIEGLSEHPIFAIHAMIPGEPLDTEHCTHARPSVRERLVADLALFFRQMHAISLDQACTWLGVDGKTDDLATELAPRYGKPLWFDAKAVQEMRPALDSVLDDTTWPIFEHTVARFEALDPKPEYMVFGHGDLHGYNAAVDQDDLGPKLAGVFDLENTGILDIHEDFFRLSLVSEPMLEDILHVYQCLPGAVRAIDRARIAVYYRAFLFYLIVGQTGQRLENLRQLLQKHLAYYGTNHGGLDEL